MTELTRIKRAAAIQAAGGPETLQPWLVANGYQTTTTTLTYPDVSFEEEGIYYLPIDMVDTAKRFRVSDLRGGWPVIMQSSVADAARDWPPERVCALLNEHRAPLHRVAGQLAKGHYQWVTYLTNSLDRGYTILPTNPNFESAADTLKEHLDSYAENGGDTIDYARTHWFYGLVIDTLEHGVRIQFPESDRTNDYYPQRGYSTNTHTVWPPEYHDAFWEAVKAAGWQKDDNDERMIRPIPPRPFNYDELDRIALWLADAGHWEDNEDHYDPKSSMTIQSIQTGTGTEMPEAEFVSGIKNIIKAFSPRVTSMYFAGATGPSITAKLMFKAKEQGFGEFVEGSMGNSTDTSLAYTAALANGNRLLMVTVTGTPMGTQSAYAAMKTTVLPTGNGKFGPLGFLYIESDALIERDGINDMRSLRLIHPHAAPRKTGQAQSEIIAIDERQYDSDGNLTIRSQDPRRFLETWLDIPIPDIVDIGQLVVEMASNGNYEFLMGFNASGRLMKNRHAWERTIGRMVAEYFQQAHQETT